MKFILGILFLTVFCFAGAQQNSAPDIVWGNTSYYNLNVNDSITFNGVSIRLLKIQKHYNLLKIGEDSLNLKVAQRSLPNLVGGINVFVADNIHVKELAENKSTHGLLSKDALIAVSSIGEPLLGKNDFIFPVTFNHGFIWSGEEDSYLFSLTQNNNTNRYFAYPGVGINLNDARGLEKHWIAAIEDCSVEWIEKDADEKSACVLLASASSPGIYYVYDRLYEKNLEIRKGQKLKAGEIIGTAWGDKQWCYLQISVVYAETAPAYNERYTNVLSFFPQLYEMYYHHTYSVAKTFTKGKIEFGRLPALNGNVQNASAFEEYIGKGWLFGKWNSADKLEWIAAGETGNVRLSKTLFKGTDAANTNPNPFYEYIISVKNGTYRIRAKVGDIEENSWQKISFENIDAGFYELKKGEQKWTAERVVRVTDHRLNIRIYVDQEENTVAGLSEIVFQQAY